MNIPLIFFAALLAIGQSNAETNSTAETPFKVSVQFDRSFYSLSYDQKVLNYSESGLRFSVAVKDCSRSVTDRIAGDYWKFAKAYPSKENEEAPQDVKVFSEEGKKPLYVARGSDFGNWLRALPARIPFFRAEARGLCKH